MKCRLPKRERGVARQYVAGGSRPLDAGRINAGFVIPVYRHGSTCEAVVRSLMHLQLPIILVDDGNDETNRRQIADAASLSGLVTVVTRKHNGGKGAAVTSGAVQAWKMGLTHIFQVDSDGQHDTTAVSGFLEAAQAHPQCVICGYPQYDESVPANRKSGRRVANNYAAFLSVNHEMQDVLCGFRVYPLGPLLHVMRWHPLINKRMGYDVDVLVHLSWTGVHIINRPVRVTYPIDGISNFNLISDNIRISAVFTALSFGLLWRFPLLYYRKKRAQTKAVLAMGRGAEHSMARMSSNSIIQQEMQAT